jgi:dolichol-phosphate mannosyltransferase
MWSSRAASGASPLSIASYFGLLTAGLSALATVVLLALTLAGALEASGELWILVSVLFLGGVQLITIGILGRYLARVHEESLHRPLYVTARVVSSRSGSSH